MSASSRGTRKRLAPRVAEHDMKRAEVHAPPRLSRYGARRGVSSRPRARPSARRGFEPEPEGLPEHVQVELRQVPHSHLAEGAWVAHLEGGGRAAAARRRAAPPAARRGERRVVLDLERLDPAVCPAHHRVGRRADGRQACGSRAGAFFLLGRPEASCGGHRKHLRCRDGAPGCVRASGAFRWSREADGAPSADRAGAGGVLPARRAGLRGGRGPGRRRTPRARRDPPPRPCRRAARSS